ncbi:MAG: glycosyl transferase [Proteobacteria bacterium]|nr:glycosyl transferase [Pseudomonadota bacterium]NDG25807.1 glycosyl transferase [Pseudomonadota bacterium]
MKQAFCTLFDIGFAPQGIALLQSIEKFMPEADRIVLAMDEQVPVLLRKVFGSSVHVIPLSDLETPELLNVKPTRSRGEYCWTLTPFLPDYVLRNFSNIDTVTYVDADVWFLSSPQLILNELQLSGKQVLITEHGYDPKYDQTQNCGRFCVQFTSFQRSEGAREVLDWWKSRCLEWCFARFEDGKFGDQKYLDVWPDLFANSVHVYTKPQHTLAPWNVEWYLNSSMSSKTARPVLYHFHGLRLFLDRTCLFDGYFISRNTQKLFYAPYLEHITLLIGENGGPLSFGIQPWKKTFTEKLRYLSRRIRKKTRLIGTIQNL